MSNKGILIVDDEKNIRLTLNQSLEVLKLPLDTAVNGEEALAKLKGREFGLILLDLKMPGMGGMEVLRQVRQMRPDIKVIIITAHGSIESAVEAMRLGAVDFIQKPFAPKEIRALVSQVMDRDQLVAKEADDYATCVELAKKCINARQFEAAQEHLKKAVSLDSSKAQALNLLGAVQEIQGDRLEGIKNYRAALAVEPSFTPAKENLERATATHPTGRIVLDSKDGGKKA